MVTTAVCRGDEPGFVTDREKTDIKPTKNTSGGEFSEFILSDLIAQGYEGKKLLKMFKEKSRLVRPAVEELIREADEFAKSGEGCLSYDELFTEIITK